jgi:hypothetical protein
MGMAQAVPARHALTESGGGANGKRDGARVSRRGGAEGPWAPTCARTYVNGTAGTGIRTGRPSGHLGASKALLVANFHNPMYVFFER